MMGKSSGIVQELMQKTQYNPILTIDCSFLAIRMGFVLIARW